MPVSVLLTRKAGSGTSVAGRVMLGDGREDSALDAPPAQFRVALWIDGKAYRERTIAKDTLDAGLTAAQIAALLKTLARETRIGTVGALYRKGKQSEATVLPPLPAPVAKAAALTPAKPADATFIAEHGAAINKALRNANDADACEDLQIAGEEEHALEAVRLTKTRMLVSTRCWLAAYNAGSGYWIINDTPPYRPAFVTSDATDFDNGT